MLTFDISDKKFCKNINYEYSGLYYKDEPFTGKLISRDADGNRIEVIYKNGHIHDESEPAVKINNVVNDSEVCQWYKAGSDITYEVLDWAKANGVDFHNMDDADLIFLRMRWY